MTRRTYLLKSAAVAGLFSAARALPLTSGPAAGEMSAREFHQSRKFVETRFGRIAYVERGSGPAAVFLHGLPLNGFQWRGALTRLAPHRRCIAPDFLGLGYTETRPGQDLAPATQAAMIDAFLEALSIPAADVVANDSGGAVAQLLTARYPKRVRTLLLTNCDVYTNSPPAAMAPHLEAARKGELAPALARQIADKALARSADGLGGVCYTNPANLTDDAIDTYLSPLVSSEARRAQLHGYMLAFEPNPLPEIELLLRKRGLPVRMVWGTADQFFGVAWADWLNRTFPHSRGVRRVEGAKLFFPEEMPDLIAEEAVRLWTGERSV
ncbi:alpha/beta fold hydrolase [Paludibaculum fermentans]|uniref:alpha/beta fold hydrolase n=1 Tax=Paludibaculum fermentans TaxID=1473598 RepID=UPI003EBFAA1C